MKFKELTKDNKDFIAKTYRDTNLSWKERMRLLEDYTGKGERAIRHWVKKLNLKFSEEVDSPELKKAKKRSFNKKAKRFIITWAQNDTPIHLEFLNNIEHYAKEINADIHVIAGRYKNPTSVFTDKSHDMWSESVQQYLDAARHDIHKYVSIMSDVKVQPTAINPMTGLQGMSGINSCIFGSPKVQMEMIPVLEKAKPKMMLTTGACTVKNYTDSKAGKKGEFHHTLGFVIVEIKDDKIFYMRQVTAEDNGNFTDLYYNTRFKGTKEPIVFEGDTIAEQLGNKSDWVRAHCGARPVELVGKTTVKRIKKIEACILGDIHYGHHDNRVLKKTYKLLDKVKPNHVILHDVFDGDSISHHAMKDPFIQYGKEVHGTNDLGREVDFMMKKLKKFEKYDNVVIVRSNHDDFLDRWLKLGDWKKQPTYKNSPLYMEYSGILLRQYAETPEDIKGVIPELINRIFPKFITLGRRDSYRVKDWELGQHGDYGSNGSRGSLVQMRKLNTKIVVGHYHSPGRKDGAIAVGTSTRLRVGYNQGPSSWAQSHVIIHEDGKAQHIVFISDDDGNVNFTTFK
tara:strand:+ start:201114 stop:202817 length:1704 start_codon:yes stop_codon:yes gene_type:complete